MRRLRRSGSKRGFVEWATYHRQGLEDTLVFPLIEEWEGVENIEEIAAVPDLGGIFFGPFDLAVSMGKPASAFEPDVPEERERVYAAAKANSLPIADLAWNVPSALEKIKLGAQLIALGTDVTLLAARSQESARRDQRDEGRARGVPEPVA